MRLFYGKITYLYPCLIGMLLCLLLNNQVQAQVSGYQGKRHYIKAEFGTGFVAGLLSDNDEYNKKILSSRYVNYNFISGRRSELMVGYQNFNGDLNFSSEGVLYGEGIKARYKVNLLSFAYRKYYSGLAPLGSYFQIDLSKLNILGEDIDKGDYYNLDEDPVIFKNSIWQLSISAGDQRVIANRFVLDIAMQVGIPPNWMAEMPFLGDGIVREYPSRTFYRKVYMHQIFKFKIGLGVLLF